MNCALSKLGTSYQCFGSGSGCIFREHKPGVIKIRYRLAVFRIRIGMHPHIMSSRPGSVFLHKFTDFPVFSKIHVYAYLISPKICYKEAWIRICMGSPDPHWDFGQDQDPYETNADPKHCRFILSMLLWNIGEITWSVFSGVSDPLSFYADPVQV
jgi:hypothetical protein